jgi:putative redox protein
MEARAFWSAKDRFLGEASSKHAVVLDAGSDKSASSPMELVLIALCACTGSDVVGILRKKRQPFTSLEMRATAERAEDAMAQVQKPQILDSSLRSE